MARKGENIYKRKDGRWEGRYIKSRTTEGKAVYGYVYAGTYREVKEKRSQKMRAEETEKKVSSSQKEFLFWDAAQLWLASVLPQVKESTANKYRNLLRDYIYPDYREVPLRQITQESVRKYRGRLLCEGGTEGIGLSAKTVSDVLSVFRRILRCGEQAGFPSSCDLSTLRVRQETGELQVLSRHEQQKLCSYLYSDINGRNIGILLCLFTGLRVGEICALRWGDISFAEQTIHIHQTMQRIQNQSENAKQKTRIVITTPKSSCSIRTIPVPPYLMEVISKYRQSESGFVLTNSKAAWIEPRNMQHYFKRVLEKNFMRKTNFHTLRHTFATRCVEVGVDIKSLSEILGHANVNITMNRYVHPSMELKKESMQRQFSLFAVNDYGQNFEI